MKKETLANKHLREGILRLGDRWDRIENLVLSPGMPDINCVLCTAGGSFEMWIESKAPTAPKRVSTPLFGSNHKVTIEQRNWIFAHRSAGGHAFIWIETDRERFMVNGAHADAINGWTISTLRNYSIWSARRPTKVRQWNELRDILCEWSR